jgi:hypothetical protein
MERGKYGFRRFASSDVSSARQAMDLVGLHDPPAGRLTGGEADGRAGHAGGGDGPPPCRRQTHDRLGNPLRRSGLGTSATEDRRSEDRATGEPGVANGVLGFSLDAVVEEDRTRVGANGADEGEVSRAVATCDGGELPWVMEVDLTEALAGAGNLAGGPERAEDVVSEELPLVILEAIEIDDEGFDAGWRVGQGSPGDDQDTATARVAGQEPDDMPAHKARGAGHDGVHGYL